MSLYTGLLFGTYITIKSLKYDFLFFLRVLSYAHTARDSRTII